MSALIDWLNASQHFFRDLGWLGVLAYAGVIVVVQLFLLPLSPIAIAGGVFFGLGRGLAAITLGTAIGAALNFLIARYVARNAIAHRLERHEKFRLIDAAIGREGWKIIALLRFCPIPFGLANFCYGLTAVRFWPYFWATVAAIIPGNAFFTWFGSTVGTTLGAGLQGAIAAARQDPSKYVFLGVGLCAGFIALTYVSRVARAAVANQSPTPSN